MSVRRPRAGAAAYSGPPPTDSILAEDSQETYDDEDVYPRQRQFTATLHNTEETQQETQSQIPTPQARRPTRVTKNEQIQTLTEEVENLKIQVSLLEGLLEDSQEHVRMLKSLQPERESTGFRPPRTATQARRFRGAPPRRK